jgi:hypothetical protein
MTDYTITTNFGAKDSLPSGNAAKVVKGSEFTTEFTNIATAVNSKADTAGDTFTGGVIFSNTVVANGLVTINDNAVVSNDLTVDTDTLVVDASENKVGINKETPTQALDVVGNITASGTLMGAIKTALFNEIYPVGSIYISTSSTSPATLFGGTWTAIGGGRVLQTVSGSSPAAGQNYGQNSRSITVANMPSHNHDFTDYTYQEDQSFGGNPSAGSSGYGSGDTDNGNYPARPISGTTQNTGSGTAFDVRQASYGVYMWKRNTLA